MHDFGDTFLWFLLLDLEIKILVITLLSYPVYLFVYMLISKVKSEIQNNLTITNLSSLLDLFCA